MITFLDSYQASSSTWRGNFKRGTSFNSVDKIGPFVDVSSDSKVTGARFRKSNDSVFWQDIGPNINPSQVSYKALVFVEIVADFILLLPQNQRSPGLDGVALLEICLLFFHYSIFEELIGAIFVVPCQADSVPFAIICRYPCLPVSDNEGRDCAMPNNPHIIKTAELKQPRACTIGVISMRYRKRLPNFVNASWLWKIIHCICVIQRERNILNEYSFLAIWVISGFLALVLI